MYKKIHKINRCTGDGCSEYKKEFTHYTFEDLTSENTCGIFNNDDNFIELGECPICGWTITLNQSLYGCYAWCSICGLEGPKHYDPYLAAKMFCDKSFTTVVKAKGISNERFKHSINIEGFSSRTIEEVKKFIQEG